jgi:hypothetical protein
MQKWHCWRAHRLRTAARKREASGALRWQQPPSRQALVTRKNFRPISTARQRRQMGWLQTTNPVRAKSTQSSDLMGRTSHVGQQRREAGVTCLDHGTNARTGRLLARRLQAQQGMSSVNQGCHTRIRGWKRKRRVGRESFATLKEDARPRNVRATLFYSCQPI